MAGRDFLETWDKFCNQIKGKEGADDIVLEFAFGLWRLWNNRNDAVFKGLNRHPLEILKKWESNITEFRNALPGVEVTDTQTHNDVCPVSKPPLPHWRKPRFGIIKLNTDAAWCNKTRKSGIGWVARDFASLLRAAGGKGNGVFDSAAAAEAHAIRTALEACTTHGFNNVIIESDAKAVIQMINKEVSWNFSFECILLDIEVLAQRLATVSFLFVPRLSNRAAHSVAKFVFKEARDLSWDHIGLEFLFNTLAEDVNISIRL